MTDGSAVLVTGASGFIGGALVKRLLGDGKSVRAAVHRASLPTSTRPASVHAVELSAHSYWGGAFEGVGTIVHCAARVHVMRETAGNPLAEFRRVNVEGTMNLARQAAAHGVRRLVFLSSIGVNGAQTIERPFRADDAASPHSPYARSKLEAELGLWELSRNTGLEVVIVRPPLVYGPGAPGHFDQLMRILYRRLPMPFASIRNQRSYVALDNLVDLLATAAGHAGAAGQILLVSDGEDLSTPELMRRLGKALQRPARLLPVSPALLQAASALLGRRDMALRLCASLQLDIAPTCAALNWSPPLSAEVGLNRAATAFLERIHA